MKAMHVRRVEADDADLDLAARRRAASVARTSEAVASEEAGHGVEVGGRRDLEGGSCGRSARPLMSAAASGEMQGLPPNGGDAASLTTCARRFLGCDGMACSQPMSESTRSRCRGAAAAADAGAGDGTAGGWTGGSVDLPRIERAVREILVAVGEDPDREGLLETPARVARMYAEMFSGLKQDPREHTQKFFTEEYDEVVLVRDISFCSMCEHHLLPFIGKAHVAYIPDGKVIGLSKIARVVEVISRRPQVQERMTEDIANLLVEELGAKGVAVVIEASHSCMTIRGVKKPGSSMVTSAMKGVFRSNLSSRAEVMQLIYGERR